MTVISDEKLYYLASDSLWCVLSLFIEEISAPGNAELFSEWSHQYWAITDWAFQERDFVRSKLRGGEFDNFLTMAEALGDRLLARWDEALRETANSLHSKHPHILKPIWLYYCYCQFLLRVLYEFKEIVQRYTVQYWDRLVKKEALLDDMSIVLGKQRPFLGGESEINKFATQALLDELETFAQQLGSQWREGVLSTARHT